MSSKPENPTYTWLELGTIPFTGHALNYRGEFMLFDNLPEYITDWEHRPKHTDRPFQEPVPVRLNYIHIQLCIQGSLSMQVNLRDVSLGQNQVLIGTPGDLCVFRAATEDVRFLNIAIKNPAFFDMAPKEMTIDLRKMLIENPVFCLSSTDAEAFLGIYKNLGQKMAEPDFPYKEELIHGYLSVMSVYARGWIRSSPQSSSSETRQEELFNRFMDELNLHFREEHEIAYYADKLCITPKYMSQLIHQASGKFASEWIRDHIVLEAKALLKSGKYTVLQVSEILNFPNPSFFSQYFKRNVGCTPKQYMNA